MAQSTPSPLNIYDMHVHIHLTHCMYMRIYSKVVLMGKRDYLFWSKLWVIIWDRCWRNAVCGEDCLQGPERFAPMWYSTCSALHQVVREVISHENVHLSMEVEKVTGDFVPWATWKLWCNHGLSLSAGRVIFCTNCLIFYLTFRATTLQM